MKKFIVGRSDERIINTGGLSLVGGALGKSDLVKRANRTKISDKLSQSQIKNGDILLTYIGLLCQGKPSFEAVGEMEDDPDYYKAVLGIAYDMPSAQTLRQRMDLIGKSIRDEILAANITMFNTVGVKPSPGSCGLVPVDIDVTPFDNSKRKREGVSRTDQGFDGYVPIMAYIGAEGYLVNTELREGKEHSQKGTSDFLRETLSLSHQMTDQSLLIRMDSGNDAAENLGILIEDGSWFVMKRNMPLGESKEEWLDKVKGSCKDIRHPRDGKNVYIGSSWRDVPLKRADGEEKSICLRCGYEIIERTMDKHGQYLFPSDIEVHTWWTNLEHSDDDVISLYHEHGESEQYHSEIKTDMDIERFPSEKFETNELVLELTVLAYNILCIIGQSSLKSERASKSKKKGKHCRLRTVISKLI